MKRMKVLFGQRRMQVLLTLAALLLAVSVVIGSGANFTSSSANPANTFTAGNLHHINSAAGSGTGEILTATKIKPGQDISGSTTITNDGDIAGNFTLSIPAVGGVSDTNVAHPAAILSQLLTVKITETVLPGGTPSVIYGSTPTIIGTNPSLPLGNFAPGESRRYDFVVTFPNGSSSHDNDYMKASTTIIYNWTAVQ